GRTAAEGVSGHSACVRLRLRIRRGDQPARNLDACSLSLSRADQPGCAVPRNLVELVAVDRKIAACALLVPCAAPERPQHRENRRCGHQREHEPQCHGGGYIMPPGAAAMRKIKTEKDL